MTLVARATVAGSIVLQGLHPKPLERLRSALTFPNPKIGYLKATKRDTTGVPEEITCMQEFPDGSVGVPRGVADLVKTTLAKDGWSIEWTDKRSIGEELQIDRQVELWPFQEFGVAQLLKYTQGTVVLPCGAGKTRLGVASIGKLRRSTLIAMHTQDLVDQWVADIKEHLGIDAGTVGDGKCVWKKVTVALIKTLKNVLEEDERFLEDGEKTWGELFGYVIVDEAHHSPADTYQWLMPRLPAKFRLALTATPDRDDRLTRLMDWAFGPRLLIKETKELVREGYLQQATVQIVSSDLKFEHDGPDSKKLDALRKTVTKDADRNDLIATIATREAKAGQSVVIVSNDRAHCRLLGRLCWEKGVETAVLVSKPGKKAKDIRAKTIEDLRSGAIKLLVTTSLFDEGVNVKRLSRVVFGLPQAASIAIQQRAGRLMRLFEGKEPVLFDIIDPNILELVTRFEKRRRVYNKMGLIIKT